MHTAKHPKVARRLQTVKMMHSVSLLFHGILLLLMWSGASSLGTAQFVIALGSLTASLALIYIILVFIDSRHTNKTKLMALNKERLQGA